jgi:hypothetical protein
MTSYNKRDNKRHIVLTNRQEEQIVIYSLFQVADRLKSVRNTVDD